MYINGQLKQISDCSVDALLKRLALSADRVVVEVNHTIVPRTDYADFQLGVNDKIEIVSFVGGG